MFMFFDSLAFAKKDDAFLSGLESFFGEDSLVILFNFFVDTGATVSSSWLVEIYSWVLFFEFLEISSLPTLDSRRSETFSATFSF